MTKLAMFGVVFNGLMIPLRLSMHRWRLATDDVADMVLWLLFWAALNEIAELKAKQV